MSNKGSVSYAFGDIRCLSQAHACLSMGAKVSTFLKKKARVESYHWGNP